MARMLPPIVLGFLLVAEGRAQPPGDPYRDENPHANSRPTPAVQAEPKAPGAAPARAAWVPIQPAPAIARVQGAAGDRVYVVHHAGRDVTIVPRPAPDVPSAPDEGDFDEEPPEKPATRPAPTRWMLDPNEFDALIYGDRVTDEYRRSHLAAQLRQAVDAVVARHQLSRAEADRLRLAGKGDIKYLAERVEAARAEFGGDWPNVKACLRFLTTLTPLAIEFRDGPFGDESLFRKTLAKILADRETARPSTPAPSAGK